MWASFACKFHFEDEGVAHKKKGAANRRPWAFGISGGIAA